MEEGILEGIEEGRHDGTKDGLEEGGLVGTEEGIEEGVIEGTEEGIQEGIEYKSWSLLDELAVSLSPFIKFFIIFSDEIGSLHVYLALLLLKSSTCIKVIERIGNLVVFTLPRVDR